MKLVRYGRVGRERPGLVDGAGRLRDLSRVIPDVTPAALGPAALRRLRALRPERLPLVRGTPRLGCPLAGIGKIVCIGLNYTDHAAEVGMPLPVEPQIFIKAGSAITGPRDPIVRPQGALKLDYEVELAAVIGRAARYVDVDLSDTMLDLALGRLERFQDKVELVQGDCALSFGVAPRGDGQR